MIIRTKLISALTFLTLFTALAASQPMPDVGENNELEQPDVGENNESEQIEDSAQQTEETTQTPDNNRTNAQDVNENRQQAQNQNKGIISGILSFLGL